MALVHMVVYDFGSVSMSSPFQKNVATFWLNENSLERLEQKSKTPYLPQNKLKKSDPKRNQSQCEVLVGLKHLIS